MPLFLVPARAVPSFQAADRRRSSAERELQARLRVFARYLPQDQFEALAEGLAVGWPSPLCLSLSCLCHPCLPLD